MDFILKEPPATFDRQSGAIKTWAFTPLMQFLQCPYRAYLRRVKKIKEAQSEPALRGDKIHKEFEDYIRGDTDRPTTNMKHKMDEADLLRERFAKGQVEVEENWGFDANWGTTGFFANNVWARIKLDAMLHESETSAVITDWKTGKKIGNELKHTKQLQIYAIGAFLRYPNLQHIEGRMEYTDLASKNLLRKTWTREKGMLLLPKWTELATSMTTAKTFQPKPNTNNCKYCPYAGKECIYGV